MTISGVVSKTCFSAYLDVHDDDAIGAVLPSLMNMSAEIGAPPAIAIDGQVVTPQTTFGEAGIHEGSWISLAADAAHGEGLVNPSIVAPRGRGSFQLRIMSGADAGHIYDISSGIMRVSEILDPDHTSRGIDAIIDVSEDGIVTLIPAVRRGEPLKKKHLWSKRQFRMHSDIYVHDEEVVSQRRVQLGESIEFPECTIAVTQGIEGTKVDMQSSDGHLRYARPPKIGDSIEDRKLRLPVEPKKPMRSPIPIVPCLIPIVMSAAMVYFTKSYTMLIFAAMSPLMMLSSYFSGNHAAHKHYKEKMRDYRELSSAMRKEASQAVEREAAQLHEDYPDPTRVFDACVVPTDMLWNRRETDDAWLRLRVGTGDVESHVTLEDPNQIEFDRIKKWTLRNVPVTVSLVDSHCIGCAGEEEVLFPLAKWMVIQLAALHSTRDLALYLLTPHKQDDRMSSMDWRFAQWLPHLKVMTGGNAVRSIGVTAEELAMRISELVSILDRRLGEKRERSLSRWSGSCIVVIMEHAHMLRTMPGMVRILQEGPQVGIYSLCVDADVRLLPEECQTVVLATSRGLTIRSNVMGTVSGVKPDMVSSEWTDSVARTLAPLEDGSPEDENMGVPSSSRLLDVLDMPEPNARTIESRWDMHPRSTVCTIGESVSGPFSIDVSKDGPHGLVGGTTGSGKSELLQSMVASLAVANRPDAMNFVLVDYKGGAAFKDCVKLPHTVGMVTDLDNHLVRRALDSLGAELTRREHMLSGVGAKDIEDYCDMRLANPSIPPMPRLMIVIDEFASLARELPDFVKGLVNIAQRGRSLGIHLILATQRPAGVVSPEIRANTNLRIALRMTDASESQDVIDAKDAALISKATPGRAVVRLGSSSLVPFQTARVGGRYVAPSLIAKARREEPYAHTMSFEDLGKAAPSRPKKKGADGDVAVTDLKVLVEAIIQASDEIGVPEQRRPWLPALPTNIPWESLPAASSGASVSIPYALGDFPGQQTQVPVCFDASTMGNLYIIGSPRSGKSTALRTIAYAGSVLYSPIQLKFQCIDGGGGSMAALSALPNVGNVVMREQTGKILRLLRKLDMERSRRMAQLSTGGYGSIDEFNAANPALYLAHIIVLIDSWDGLNSVLQTYDNGSIIDRLQVMMREGAIAGIHFIVSGDSALRSGKMLTLANSKVALRLVDSMDYSIVGMTSHDVPEKVPEGRGYRSPDGAEIQIALVGGTADGQQQTEYIRSMGQRLFQQRDYGLSPSQLPIVISELPQKLSLGQLLQSIDSTDMAVHGGALPLGIGGEDNEVVWFDHRATTVLPIFGTQGSGKSMALAVIARLAAERGIRTLLVAPPRSTVLRDFDKYDTIEMVKRPQELTAEMVDRYAHDPDALILIDDCARFASVPGGNALKQMMAEDDPRTEACLVATMGTKDRVGFSDWPVEIRKRENGILLRPEEVGDATLIGSRLRAAQVRNEAPVGRGFMHIGSQKGSVQLAYDESVGTSTGYFDALPVKEA